MRKLFLALAMLSTSLFANVNVEKVVLTKSNTLVFNEVFGSTEIANLSQKAQVMDAALPGKDPIYLILDTPGGSIQAGVEFCSFVSGLNRPVHTISIFAASMGFHTVQCIKGKRYVFNQGVLMSHKARGGFYGEFPGQLDARYNMYLQRINQMDQIVVDRTGGKYTLKSYQDLIENEYWCTGSNCVKDGFADSLLDAKCDSSLNGEHGRVYDRFISNGALIEIVEYYSNCPLITGALSFKIFINGEPLFTLDNEGNRIVSGADFQSFTRPVDFDRHIEAEVKERIAVLRAKRENREVVKGY